VPFIELKGGRLNYRTDGPDSGPAILLSNLLGTSMGVWDSQVAPLARHFRVVRYDTRGHGLSDIFAGPLKIEALGRDALALLDELGIERAHFCGLSLGGLTGLWLGINAADRIDRLALCNMAARVGTVEGWNTRIGMVRQGGMEAIVSATLQRWFTPGFIAGAPTVIEAMRQMLLQTPSKGYVACCEALRDANLAAEASRVTARTLVVSGTHDPVTPPEAGHFLAEKIQGARYVELPASHISNVEAAEPFTAALLDFLNEAPKSREAR